MQCAERIRRLPPPDLSSDTTAFCDTTAAAAIGEEADTVLDAAEQLLLALQPVHLPLEACRRVSDLAAAVNRARGLL